MASSDPTVAVTALAIQIVFPSRRVTPLLSVDGLPGFAGKQKHAAGAAFLLGLMPLRLVS